MSRSHPSVFSQIQIAPPIEVFALVAAFNEDNHPNKVNLSVGAYRTDESKPWVLPVVHRVEVTMANDQSLNKEYLPVVGLKDYCDGAVRLLVGPDSSAIQQQKVMAVQALGGTGALRLGADFLFQQCGKKIAYVTNPTWDNHGSIFKNAGFEVRSVNYWNAASRSIDWDSVSNALLEAPEGSVFVLHACAHNPTGVDLTQEHWKEVAQVMKARNLFPFFDIAYQGFASGDLDQDAWAVRYFISNGFEMCVAQSFSKNFGLYNERVGNLVLICAESHQLTAIKSQAELIVRRTWSNPPSHGARIVASILNNPALQAEWRDNVKTMAERIKLMRQKLYEKLKAHGTPGTWEHIVQQRGMFSYTGLNERQVEFLMKEYHIYVMKSGRINMCGLNLKNLDYVANAFHEAVTTVVADPKL